MLELDEELRATEATRVADVSDELRARALYCAGTFLYRQNDVRGALALGEASLALARAAGDPLEQLHARNLIAVSAQNQGDLRRARESLEAALGLARAGRSCRLRYHPEQPGTLAHDSGDYRSARAFYEESLAITRQQGLQNVAIELYNLGELARLQGDDVRARTVLEETLAISARTGDVFSLAGTLAELGQLARNQADFAAAERHFQQALELREKHGEHRRLAHTLSDLGDLARDQQQPARAQEYYERSLTQARQLDDAWGAARAAHGLSVLSARQGYWDRATSTLRDSIRDYDSVQEPYEMIAARREAMGAPVPPPDRERYLETDRLLRAALGDAAYRAILAEAAGVPLEHVILET